MRLPAIIIAVLITSCRGGNYIDETGPNCFNGDHEACHHLETQCQAGMAEQCYWLGLVRERPDSLEQDLASSAFGRACALGLAAACKRMNS